MIWIKFPYGMIFFVEFLGFHGNFITYGTYGTLRRTGAGAESDCFLNPSLCRMCLHAYR